MSKKEKFWRLAALVGGMAMFVGPFFFPGDSETAARGAQVAGFIFVWMAWRNPLGIFTPDPETPLLSAEGESTDE